MLKNSKRLNPPKNKAILSAFAHKEKYLNYLKSEQWANIKLDLIHIKGENCELCGQHRQAKYLNLHHITYKNLFNENPQDLLLLCYICHRIQHKLVKNKSQKIKKKKSSPIVNKEIKVLNQLVKSRKISVETYVNKIIQLRNR